MFQIKYFAFTDPVTGNISKGYGYSYTLLKQNVVVKRKDKEVVVKKNEGEEETRHIVPRFEGVRELTKQEFDALDVKGESLLSQFNREKQFLHLKKLERRFSQDPKKETDEEIKRKFK